MEKRNPLGMLVLFIMGIIFTIGGLALVYYLGQDIKFSCERSVNQCVIEKTNVFGNTEVDESFKLSSLAGAEIIEKRDSEGDYTYKVMLITDDGRVPLSVYSSSGRKQHKLNASQINNYVKSGEENLEIRQSGKLIRIFGFVFAVVGLLMILPPIGSILKFIILLFVIASKR